MFKPVGSVIASRGRFGKSSEAILALQVRAATKKAIDAICADLPADIVAQVKVKSFKNGALNIVAPSLLSSELYTRSGELKKGINDVLGRNIVKNLRFRGS